MDEYMINLEEALVGFVLNPKFMLWIWYKGDWLKEIFGLAQSMVEWYMEVPNLVSICICIYVFIPNENNEHMHWLMCLFYD